MLRKLAGIVVALVLFTGILLADEAKGKFKKWDKGTLTVKVGDKDVEYKLTKDSKVLNGDEEVKGKKRAEFFKDLKDDSELTIVYDKDGDKITVKEVKFKK